MPVRRKFVTTTIGKPEMSIFKQKPVQTSVKEDYIEQIRCINLNSTDNRSPLEFHIDPHDDSMISPDIMLHLQLKISGPGGADLDALKPVGCINQLLTSLFSTAEIVIGSTCLPHSIGAYPYVSYLDSLLNYSTTAQKTILTKSLFYRDTSEKFNNFTTEEKDGNVGFISRNTWTIGGMIDLLGSLHLDIATSGKWLPHKLGVNIKLHRSQTPFVLLGDVENNNAQYIINISLAELEVHRYKINPADLRSIESNLSRAPAIYDYTSTSMFAITFPLGTTQLETVIHSGRLPSKITVVMTSIQAYNGSYKHNPYLFEHFDLRSIQAEFNGQLFPRNVQTLSYGPPYNISSSYLSLIMDNSPGPWQRSDIDISPEDFMHGYSIFSIPLWSDYDPGSNYKSEDEWGNLTLKLELAKTRSAPFMVLCFIDQNRQMTVDRDGSVSVM